MTTAITRTRRPLWMTPFGRESFGDVFFDRLWPEWQRDRGEEWTPNTDLTEKDGAYHLTAEVPGLKKEDITVAVENGYVTVKGKKEDQREEKGEEYFLKETRSGSFCRSFRLPSEVDTDHIDATYKDGVLKVVLPHKEGSKGKNIEIH
jgi:HSP20 family protein